MSVTSNLTDPMPVASEFAMETTLELAVNATPTLGMKSTLT